MTTRAAKKRTQVETSADGSASATTTGGRSRTYGAASSAFAGYTRRRQAAAHPFVGQYPDGRSAIDADDQRPDQFTRASGPPAQEAKRSDEPYQTPHTTPSNTPTPTPIGTPDNPPNTPPETGDGGGNPPGPPVGGGAGGGNGGGGNGGGAGGGGGPPAGGGPGGPPPPGGGAPPGGGGPPGGAGPPGPPGPPGSPGPPAQIAPVPVVFAEMPAQYAAANVIDYGTSTGWKHWYEATQQLPGDEFACLPEQINVFCENLNKRAINSGWNLPGADIVNIPDDDGVPSVDFLLLERW